MTVFPLSAEQHSLVFLDGLFGPGIFHNVTFVCPVPPGTRVDAVRAAVTDVVTRHDALRCMLVGTAPFLLTVGPARPEVSVHAVDGGTGVAGYAERRRAELHNHPLYPRTVGVRAQFEYLDGGPDREGRLLVAMDHLVSDVESVRILAGDLTASLSGRPPGAQPSSQSTLWRRREVNLDVERREIGYWRKVLDGIPALTGRLPALADRPTWVSTQRNRTVRGTAYLSTVHGLVARHSATPFAVIATLLAIAVWHRTGRRRFPVHTPLTTRLDEQTEAMVGYFVNDRPIPCTVDPDQALAEALHANVVATWRAARWVALSVPELAHAVAAYGEMLVGDAADYIQLHVRANPFAPVAVPDAGEHVERFVHGPFTPARDLTVTTFNVRLSPEAVRCQTFFGGPPQLADHAAALGDDLLALLRAAGDLDDPTVGRLASVAFGT
jgi:hypothetical protein